jgi:hypothetical protein
VPVAREPGHSGVEYQFAFIFNRPMPIHDDWINGLGAHLAPSRGWIGRPNKDRQALAGAFIAKAAYGLQTTRQLIERLKADRQLLRVIAASLV